MKKANQFVQDLGESLQIGMKRLLIAMAVILLIVFVGVGGFFLYSRVSFVYAQRKVSDTYLQNMTTYQTFLTSKDDSVYTVRYTRFFTPSDELESLGVHKIYEEVNDTICFEQEWRILGHITQGILYAPMRENVLHMYHLVELGGNWYYYWIP